MRPIAPARGKPGKFTLVASAIAVVAAATVAAVSAAASAAPVSRGAAAASSAVTREFFGTAYDSYAKKESE